MPFEIFYTTEAVQHLSEFSKADQVTIVDQVDQLLMHEPILVSRKRKLLRPNTIALWELRIGNFRIFYDVVEAPMQRVTVKAIGKKSHNELWIGGARIIL
jgi:mRNA-degrading endonuclease RelE of RelBE toxin-antitoxin system